VAGNALIAFLGRFLFMFCRSHIALALAAASVFAVPSDQAEAQGFFEQFFGSSAPPNTRNIVVIQPQARSSVSRSNSGDDDNGRSEKLNDTYRTVCVRTCDGSFFPISFSTTRKNFQTDQAKCTASCGDARLYAYRNPGSGIDEAIDISGRAYTALPMAFAFKKKVVEGCTCRPPPWSEAELQRHKTYADAGGAPGVAASTGTDAMAKSAQGLSAIVSSTDHKIATPNATTPSAVVSKTQTPPAAAVAVFKSPNAKRITLTSAASPRLHRAPPNGVMITMGYGVPKKSNPGFVLPAMGLGGNLKFKWPGD
jgi:hypothetical protein